MNEKMSRRSALGKITWSAATMGAAASLPHRLIAADQAADAKVKGNIHHSVSAWCYNRVFRGDSAKMTFADF